MTSHLEEPDKDTALDRIPAPDGLGQPEAGTAAEDAGVWKMLADISQSLQMAAASIKVAISSLLDTTIIWDRSAQHEFMTSINQSIDRSIPLVVAMTLAMKSEGGTLGSVIENNSIQEILARVIDSLERDGVAVPIALTLPAEGKPVLVDYDYLRIALKMLMEALIFASDAPPANLRVSAVADVSHWSVRFEGGFSGQASQLIAWLGSAPEKRRSLPGGVNSELMLKAFTASRILDQQRIALVTPDATPSPASFILEIPASGN